MELIKSILSQLGINETFFYEFVLVILAYVFLSRGVFRPLLKILNLRREKTIGKRKLAEEALIELQRKHEEYNKRWKSYEENAFSQKDVLFRETQKKVKNIIQEAEKEARHFLKEGRKGIRESVRKIQGELNKDIPVFADDIKNRLLARKEL